jgi:hypothetical protein
MLSDTNLTGAREREKRKRRGKREKKKERKEGERLFPSTLILISSLHRLTNLGHCKINSWAITLPL